MIGSSGNDAKYIQNVSETQSCLRFVGCTSRRQIAVELQPHISTTSDKQLAKKYSQIPTIYLRLGRTTSVARVSMLSGFRLAGLREVGFTCT